MHLYLDDIKDCNLAESLKNKIHGQADLVFGLDEVGDGLGFDRLISLGRIHHLDYKRGDKYYLPDRSYYFISKIC